MAIPIEHLASEEMNKEERKGVLRGGEADAASPIEFNVWLDKPSATRCLCLDISECTGLARIHLLFQYPN